MIPFWHVQSDISLWFLICISLMINDVEHLSTYLLVICVSSLEKMYIQASIFNFLLSCMISFCILDINPFLDISFANIFPT